MADSFGHVAHVHERWLTGSQLRLRKAATGEYQVTLHCCLSLRNPDQPQKIDLRPVPPPVNASLQPNPAPQTFFKKQAFSKKLPTAIMRRSATMPMTHSMAKLGRQA